MDSHQILKSPIVTEKSTAAQAKHKFMFWVNQDANKIQVAQAVEDAYGVDVTKVNLVWVRSKTRLAGRGKTITKRSTGKKAIVTIAAKQTIDFNKLKTK